MDGDAVYLRPMGQSDVAHVRQLHDVCLPFAYRASFYTQILRDPGQQFALLAALKPRDLPAAGCDGGDKAHVDSDGGGGGNSGALAGRGTRCDEVIVAAITGQYIANTSGATAAGGVAGETFPASHDLGGAVVAGGTTLLYVRSLVVSPQHRRQGLGAHLLRRCIQDARRRQACAGIYLHVVSSNRPAVALYHSQGFTRAARIRRLYEFESRRHDGLVYVLCVNSGRLLRNRPCTIL